MKIHVFDLRKGIFQVIVIIRKTRVRLDLANAVSLQDRAEPY